MVVIGKLIVVGLAALFVAQLLVAVVGCPRWFVRWITAADAEPTEAPRTIVVLGGGGIPSESGLMRCYAAAALGTNYPGAAFIVSLPAAGDPAAGSVGRMRDELVMRGVPAGAVAMETRARNTHEQAEAIRVTLGDAALREPLLIVTSPSHGRRSLLCFRRAGFERVACAVTRSAGVEAELGRGLAVRYGFWRNLEMHVRYGRELTALAVYKLRGWI